MLPAESPSPKRGASEPSAEALVTRIAVGDRFAAAEFVRRYSPVIRQRYRVRLSPALRRLADSTDLASTVARRLDALVANGGLEVANQRQLWALIHRLADTAVADKARALARLRRVEGEDAEWSRAFLSRVDEGPDLTERFDGLLDRLLDGLPEERDRQVLGLWLAGWSHAQIGVELGMNANAVRQLWSRLRERVKSLLAEEGP